MNQVNNPEPTFFIPESTIFEDQFVKSSCDFEHNDDSCHQSTNPSSAEDSPIADSFKEDDAVEDSKDSTGSDYVASPNSHSQDIATNRINHFSFNEEQHFTKILSSQAHGRFDEDNSDNDRDDIQSPLRLPFLIDDDDESQQIHPIDEIFTSLEQNLEQDHPMDDDLREANNFFSSVSVQGNRSQMQDKYYTFTEFGNMQFYAVFDGHGTDKIATFLQQHLFQAISTHPSFQIHPAEAITQTFLTFDELFQNSSEFNGSGCVCVCALIINGHIYIANLGDCRAVLFNKAGNHINLSYDHTPDIRQDEVERILSQNGICIKSGNQLRVSGELNVTRAFGDKRNKPFIIAEPEIFTYEIASLLAEFQYQDIFLVLASDGLWNDYNSSKATYLCSEGFLSFPEKALNQIYEDKECLRDNTTILAVNIQQYFFSLLESLQTSTANHAERMQLNEETTQL